MNFSVQDIVGIINRLTSWLDGTTNYLAILQSVIENESTIGVPDKQLLWDMDRQSINNLIRNGGDFTYIRLQDVANELVDQLDDSGMHVNQIIIRNQDDEQVGVTTVQDVMTYLSDNRQVIEETLTLTENALSVIEDEVDDGSLQLSSLVDNISSTTVGDSILKGAKSLFNTLGGKLVPETAAIFVYKMLSFSGFFKTNDADQTNQDQVETISGQAPITAWANALADGFNSLTDFADRAWTYLHSGKWAVQIFGAIGAGISWAVSKAVEWTMRKTSNLLLDSLGAGSGMIKTGYTGDSTVSQTGYELVIPLEEPGYAPNIATRLAQIVRHSSGQGNLTGWYSLGAKYLFQLYVDSDDVAQLKVTVTPKMVDFFKLKQFLDDHGVYLNFSITMDETTGAISSTSNVGNIDDLTISDLKTLVTELEHTDLSFSDYGFHNNQIYALGIYAGKIVDAMHLYLVAQCDVSLHLQDTFQPDDWSTFLRRTTNSHASDLSSTLITNIGLADRACRYIYESAVFSIGGFNSTNGVGTYDMNTWRNIYSYTFVTLLFALEYSYVAGSANTDFWISYLRRDFKFKPSYAINSDTGVSATAMNSWIKLGAIVAVAAVTVLAVKFIPKIITKSRQLSMQADTAAFNYGDNPTIENYKKWKKLRLKSKLLGGSISYASSSIDGVPINISSNDNSTIDLILYSIIGLPES